MLEEAIRALGHWNHQESAFRSISGCDFSGPLHFAAVAYDFMPKRHSLVSTNVLYGTVLWPIRCCRSDPLVLFRAWFA
jgi:hypothetical protein